MSDSTEKMNRNLGRRLRMCRIESNLSQEELGRILGVCQSTYGNYEIGKLQMKANMLPVLADLYDTTTDYLLGRTDIK